MNEKTFFKAFAAQAAKTIAAHNEEARLAKEVVARLGRIQRRARLAQNPSREEIAGLSQSNDRLTEAESRAGSEIIELANTYLE